MGIGNILLFTFRVSALLFCGRSAVAIFQSEWIYTFAISIIQIAPEAVIQPAHFAYEWFLWGVIEPFMLIVLLPVKALYFIGGPIVIWNILVFILTIASLFAIFEIIGFFERLTFFIDQIVEKWNAFVQTMLHIVRQIQPYNPDMEFLFQDRTY